MRAIITIKLKRNSNHNPKDKKKGKCPIINNEFCSDITGEHHSYIETGNSLKEIESKAKNKYSHITRIELIKK